MKTGAISLTEFGDYVKELMHTAGKTSFTFHHSRVIDIWICYIDGYELHEGGTPEIALEKLKNAINPKQIKNVII